jgi:integrase
MPKKYQNPKLEKRTDVATPFWFIRVRVQDPSKKKARTPLKLGFVHEMNLKEAMRKRGEILHTVNAGLLISQAQVRFRELVEQFKSARIPLLGTAASARYVSCIDRHILPAFGERMLMDIDRPMVEAWLAGKEKDGLSWWSRQGLKGVLGAIFAAAKEWSLWTGDAPTTGVKLGRKRLTREKRLVTSDQFRAILLLLREETRFMILIAALVGLRISEVLGLQWRDIDLDAETLTVSRRWYRGDVDEPKNEAAERTRQIPGLASEFRRRYPGPQARERYVFTGDDGQTPPDERDILRYELRPVLKRLKLHYPGFGWHAFRRMNITLRQHEGATPIEAQKQAGHSSLDMTMLYSLTEAGRERQQVERIFELLTGPAEGPKQ